MSSDSYKSLSNRQSPSSSASHFWHKNTCCSPLLGQSTTTFRGKTYQARINCCISTKRYQLFTDYTTKNLSPRLTVSGHGFPRRATFAHRSPKLLVRIWCLYTWLRTSTVYYKTLYGNLLYPWIFFRNKTCKTILFHILVQCLFLLLHVESWAVSSIIEWLPPTFHFL